MTAELYRSVYDLAARVGSLEGHLYVGKDIETGSLPGWLDNIRRQFDALPPDARTAIAKDHGDVLAKVTTYLERLYGSSDPSTSKAREMLAGARGLAQPS